MGYTAGFADPKFHDRNRSDVDGQGKVTRKVGSSAASRFYVATHTSKRGLRFYTIWAESERKDALRNNLESIEVIRI